MRYSRAPRRILHTSDLHLDRPGDNASACLERVVSVALDECVDLVVIAGDLFDHNRVDDAVIEFVVEQLGRLSGPAVILPGNHDCLVAGSVLKRAELSKRCGNVYLFSAPEGEILDVPAAGVSLWGKSIDSHDGDVRPMDGVPRPRGNGWWNVAVAHGYYVSGDHPLFPSYHIMPDELAACGWDYIALGHVPVFRCVSAKPVPAYYSGSPMVSGTVALVELDDDSGVRVRACPL